MTIKTERPKALTYIFVSLFLMILSAGLFINSYNRMNDQLDRFKIEIFQKAESWLGFQIEYESISPSLFRYLEIRNLRIFDPVTGKDVLFIGRVRIYYSILAFFKGSLTQSVTRISVENSLLRYAPENDPALVSLISRNRGDQANTDFSFLSGIEITGRNLAIRYQEKENDILVEKLFFSLKTREDQYQISIRGQTTIELTDDKSPLTRGRGEIQLNGTLEKSFQEAETHITLKDFDSNLVQTKKISFQLAWKDSIFVLRKIQDRVPYDLSMEWDRKNEKLKMNMVSENFIPSNFFLLRESLQSVEPWLNVSFTGSLEGIYALNTKELNYSTSMDLRIPMNQMVPFPLIAGINARGDLNNITVKRLDLQSSKGAVFFTGSLDLTRKFLFPEGTLKASGFTVLDQKFSGLFYLNRMREYNSIQSPWLSLGELGFRDTAVQLYNNELSSLDIILKTSSSDVDWENYLSAEGNVTLGEIPFFQVLFEASDFPLEKAGDIFLPGQFPASFTEDLVLNTQGFFSTNFDQFSFNASRFTMEQHALGQTRISLSFTGNDSGLNFRDLVIDIDENTIQGTGRVNWEDPDSLDFSLAALYRENSYEVSGSFQPGNYLQLSGSYGLKGTLLYTGNGLSLNFQARDLPLPTKENLLFVSVNCKGAYLSNKNWHLLVERISLSGIPSLSGEPWGSMLELSGQFSPQSVQIYNLKYEDPFSFLQGNGLFDYTMDSASPSAKGWLQLQNPRSAENYLISLGLDGKELNSSISIFDLPLYRLGDLPLDGFVSGQAQITGSVSNPDISCELSLREGRLNDTPVDVETRVDFLQEEIRFSGMSLNYLNQRFELSKGYYNFLQGKLSFAGDFSGTMQENPLSAEVNIEAEINPLESRKDIAMLKDSDFSGWMTVGNIRLYDQEGESWRIDFTKADSVLTFAGGPKDSVYGSFNGKKEFDFVLSPVMPLSFRARGQLAAGNVEAQLDDILLNFEGLEKLFRIPGFTVSTGEARGRILVSGPVNDPDLFGSLTLKGVTGGLEVLGNLLTLSETTLTADQKTLSIENLIVESTEGAAILNCEFNLDHLVPYSYHIYLESIYNRDLLLDLRLPGIQTRGYVQGYLDVAGDLGSILLTGDLKVNNATITMGNPVKSGTSKIELATDIHIVLGNNNTFYWPSRNLPLLKTYAESGEELNITSNTVDNSFGLKGRVVVKGGEIFYFRKNFYLQEGSLVFNENQDRFDPILNARAVIREVDSLGNLVRVYLIADNMSLLNFNPRFESDPMKSNEEILALMGAGLFDSQDNDVLLSNAILLTSDVVSQFGFFQSLQDSVIKNLGLDVFSLRSQIVPNLIMERLMTEEEQNYISNSSFARYLDNTTLFIGKYFGSDFFLQGIVQMDFYGNSIDDLYFYPQFNIDTEITLEWKSPVALIELSLYPDLLDMTDSLLTSSLSLSWSFSY